ncbi:MAG: GxxExxY protein [bacterium]|nr:MAG: GxxExxY protein [bacterium]
MKEKLITEKVIGCAYTVYNKMGSGFLESVYEKCLKIELLKLGLKVETQKPIEVRYEGKIVGEFVSDILVEGNIIVELKAIHQLNKIHEAQLVNYLTATGLDIGLLINFSDECVQVKRKVRVLNKK